MSILLLYATTEGQTKKIAERCAGFFHNLGKTAVLHDISSSRPLPPLASFEGVILAASVHQGYHQESATDFAAAAAETLNEMRTAFISVSLSAAMPDGKAEAQEYCNQFLKTTGWHPHDTLLLGGAIRLSGYDYFERQVMKYILAQKGITDITTDYECTDWTALESFIQQFVRAEDPARTMPGAAAGR